MVQGEEAWLKVRLREEKCGNTLHNVAKTAGCCAGGSCTEFPWAKRSLREPKEIWKAVNLFRIRSSSRTCFNRPAICGPKSSCSCQVPACLCWLQSCIWAVRQDQAPVVTPYTQDTAICKCFLAGLMLPNCFYWLALLWLPWWKSSGWGNSVPFPSYCHSCFQRVGKERRARQELNLG